MLNNILCLTYCSHFQRQKMKPQHKLEGTLTNDELKKLKSSWNVAGMIITSIYVLCKTINDAVLLAEAPYKTV